MWLPSQQLRFYTETSVMYPSFSLFVYRYHLRSEVAKARFKMLPVIEDFPIDAVPVAPRPGDSEIYEVRGRVPRPIFPHLPVFSLYKERKFRMWRK